MLTETVMEHLPGAPARGQVRRFARGVLIYAMGDPTGDVFFLRRGRVAISVISPRGREQRLLVVQPGEMFGELCFCDIQARQDQAMALLDCEVVALRMDDLLEALLASAGGAAAILGTLCARVSDAQAQVQRMAFYTVPQRVGLLLLDLAGAHPESARTIGAPPASEAGSAHASVLAHPPTHEEIAQSVGASRELVSTTLSGLRRLGLVRYRRGSTMTIHPDALRRHLDLPAT